MDLSNSTYSLSLLGAGAFNATGYEINLGAQHLSIAVANTITMAAINGQNASSVTLTGSAINITQPINVGTGNVVLLPSNNEPVGVGGPTHNPGEFDVSAQDMLMITAGTLEIGSINQGGGISLQGNVDVSGSGAGVYNLTFANGGNYSDGGYSLTLGKQNLTVYQLGGATCTSTGNLDISRLFDSYGNAYFSAFIAVAGGNICFLQIKLGPARTRKWGQHANMQCISTSPVLVAKTHSKTGPVSEISGPQRFCPKLISQFLPAGAAATL